MAQLWRSLVRNFRVEIEIVGVFLGLQFQFILMIVFALLSLQTPPLVTEIWPVACFSPLGPLSADAKNHNGEQPNNK